VKFDLVLTVSAKEFQVLRRNHSEQADPLDSIQLLARGLWIWSLSLWTILKVRRVQGRQLRAFRLRNLE